jgi:hypothetical protein
MPEHTNLYAFTEPTPAGGYPGYVSLNREPSGAVTLTVRSPGHGGNQVGTITLPEDVATALATALTLGGVELVAGGLDPDVLVQRFLTWPVPADVYPDGTPGQPGRTGTNLLSAPQAKAMLQHVLGG